MKNTEITFKEFTKTYISDFPDKFRYLGTPLQIYTLEDLSSGSIATPTPLLKANFNFIILPTTGSFEQQVGNLIKKVSENQALLVMQGEVTSLLRKTHNIKGYYIISSTAVQRPTLFFQVVYHFPNHSFAQQRL
ncbi:hypothetical protein FXV77_12235 [Sphingobacterium phlebotomi]|uniref:Uncharacterized protein n=1 Tax=Sphingobacterium phlebotomi TaxID=2605433 RepID=A0A5D4H5F2_9SPHI|nr:hypothetical protein [Sphingobacterium phlebotomi]TYR35837.1 hypothetical protein FXV77_12235 [Sphingobacterium phlebotomi]